jgi:hypothetical protein
MKELNQKKSEKPLSPDARSVWDQLDGLTRQQIQKTNPLKQVRNQRIRELKAKGLKAETLAEITGLGRGAIFRISKDGNSIPDYAKREVKAMTGAFESFLEALSKVLNDGVEGRHEEDKP